MSILGDFSLTNTEEWTKRAKCREHGHDDPVFFPKKFSQGGEAKRICASCPVRKECLEYALRKQERFGIWGGLTTAQRDLLVRQGRSQSRRGRHPVNCTCPIHRRRA